MERLSFDDFYGGLNLITPGELIDMNQMQEATNFEFSPEAGLFKVRGGIDRHLIMPEEIQDMFPIAGTNAMLIRAGGYLYTVINQDYSLVGTVKGDAPGTFEYWGEANGVVMAFGGPLYVFDTDSSVLSEVDSADCPTAVTAVFYRAGRVAVVQDGSDTITYSGIGDPYQWTNDPDDASTSQSVDIGYMDGCNITAVGELGGELIVFKAPEGQPEHGRIYRLANEFPNWTITLYSKGNSAWNSKAVKTLGDDLIFITKEGIASLATSMNYGDFQMKWPGRLINPRFAKNTNDFCRLWVLNQRMQVWAWDGTSNEIYVRHYQIGDGAWTKFEMPGIIKDVAMVSGHVYIAIDNTVYEMSDALTSDYDNTPIHAYWTPKTINRRNAILTKMIIANYMAGSSTKAELVIEGLRIPLEATDVASGDIAALDNDVAALDTDPLVDNRTSIIRKRCQFVRWNITPRLEVTNGLFSAASVKLEIAEV
jgi:hypothetical protein